MWFKHSMSIAPQLIPIYNTTVHKNKRFMLPLMWLNCLCHKLTKPTGGQEEIILKNFLCDCVKYNLKTQRKIYL